MIANFHLKAFGAPHDGLSNATQPDNAETFPEDLSTERKVGLGPFSRADETVTFRNATRDIKDQAERQIGDAFIQDVRRIADDNAPLPRLGDIDGVKANPETANRFQIWECFDDVGLTTETSGRNDDVE